MEIPLRKKIIYTQWVVSVTGNEILHEKKMKTERNKKKSSSSIIAQLYEYGVEEGDPCSRLHPVWRSSIGSTLRLEMIVPPDSQLKALVVTVASIASPTLFKLTSHYYSSYQGETIYCTAFEARSIVKNEWMKHYKSRTRIIWSPHVEVDISELINYKSRKDNISVEKNHQHQNSEDKSIKIDSGGGIDDRDNAEIYDVSRSPWAMRKKSSGGSPRDWFKRRRSLPLKRSNTCGDLEDGEFLAPAPRCKNDTPLESPTEGSPIQSPIQSPRPWFLRTRESSPRSREISPRSPVVSPKWSRQTTDSPRTKTPRSPL